MSDGGIDPGYPAACLRGIRISKWIVDDGVGGKVLAAEAFKFEESDRAGLANEGWREVSINWEDDAEAMEFTRRQKSTKGLPLNQNGVGRLSVAEIAQYRTMARITGTVAYERRTDPEQPDNRYHGNLLLAPGVPTAFQRQLAAALGLLTRLVP